MRRERISFIPLSIAEFLQDPVTVDFFRMTLSILFPVTGMGLLPFFLAQLPAFSIFTIGSSPGLLPSGLPCALTGWRCTEILIPVPGDKECAAVNAGN
jgi:hypothetical protein